MILEVFINMIFNNFIFPVYGIIILLSIVIGMMYIYFFLKKANICTKNIFLCFILLISFSITCGKLFTMFTNSNIDSLLEAGLSSYGGLVGLILSSYIFEKLENMNGSLIKASILSLPLIYGIGKIACFLVGCCYGIPHEGLFSVTYTEGLNIPLFPIQLVETIVFITIFIICNKLKDNKNIIYIVLFLCIIFKFLLDFLRYDHVTKILTVNQVFSIILLVVILLIYILKILVNKKI